ncbi:DUF5819 family protein [Streptomyces rhizosphaericus]|uniref:Uncharacterized protein n=1 Tax=Streptomyces rhizosphaericus TaxID=114699 RepID=A0ABP3ZSY1_9ACTN|nr:DUF5819 family protein [Streptomyces cangkringensis]
MRVLARSREPEDAPPVGGGALPLNVRISALIALAAVAVYCLCCLVYNAPASPAKDRIKRPATAFMEPYFWQDWQLFGPTPGTNNDLIYLRARMKLSDSGRVVESSPVEIEQAIDRSPHDFPVNPTKLPGVLLAFDAAANRYAGVANKFKKLPAARRDAARRLLDKQFSADFEEMWRFFSVQAKTLYPDAQIIAVQATFKNRAIIPFSERYEVPRPKERAQGILATSWMDYVPGVAQ